MPRWVVVDDDAVLPTAAEYRERSERARVEARSRYRDHLTEVLSRTPHSDRAWECRTSGSVDRAGSGLSPFDGYGRRPQRMADVPMKDRDQWMQRFPSGRRTVLIDWRTAPCADVLMVVALVQVIGIRRPPTRPVFMSLVESIVRKRPAGAF